VNLDDALRILGVGDSASAADVRVAFRRGLHERHPDRHGSGNDAHARTRDFIEAYRIALAHTESLVATRTVNVDNPVFEAEATAARFVEMSSEQPVAQRLASDAMHRSSGIDVRAIGDDTIALDCPADEAYPLLVDVAHRIGDVTHVDRSSFEFLEFLVRSVSGDTLSVVCSLQGRSNGTTEVFFTLEPLEVARGPLPNIDEIVHMFVDRLSN
jgi:hypothetical protein